MAIDNVEEFLLKILGRQKIAYATALGTVIDLSKNRSKEND